MDSKQFESTVSESKEESLQKAIALLQKNDANETPLFRPKISLSKLLIAFFAWIFFCVFSILSIVFFGKKVGASSPIVWGCCLLLIVAVICLKSKSFVQSSILIYQKYAPEELRRACLFTPSCSEYMLLAIEKYGLIQGVLKGCKRLGRCRYGNGGVDDP